MNLQEDYPLLKVTDDAEKAHANGETVYCIDNFMFPKLGLSFPTLMTWREFWLLKVKSNRKTHDL